MVEIPENPEEWTYGRIVDLVHEGYDENEVLEYKLLINSESERIAQTVCSFANTNGGTIIFGINNDRTKIINTNDRIVGLEDADQLKRSIIDKIKNIKPNIPIENLVFRKANVVLPNKKVIVILKVERSGLAPHQYKNIFYKRLLNGNEPMEVEEIKNTVIESTRNQTSLNLFISESGYIRYQLRLMKDHFDKNEIRTTVEGSRYLDASATTHFLYHQSYLYHFDVQEDIRRIVEIIEKIKKYRNVNESFLNADPEIMKHTLKDSGCTTAEEWIKNMIYGLIVDALKKLENLETLLQIKFPEPIMEDLK